MADQKDLTEGFAFVAAASVPKREQSDRLAEYREQNKEARLIAGRKVAKGLLSGKALTDNVVYEMTEADEENGISASTGAQNATRVASRAKALVNPALAEDGKRASVSVTGNAEDGFRWFIIAKDLADEE